MARQKGPSRRARLEAERRAKQRRQRILFGGLAAALVLFGVGALVLTDSTSDAESAAATTSPAPEVELATVNGDTVSLSDYRGRPVALTFMHSW